MAKHDATPAPPSGEERAGEETTAEATTRRAAAAPPVLAAGVLCDERHLVICSLSASATAEIYKAYDTRARRAVALKVLRRGHLPNDQVLERTIADGRVLQETNHQGLVKVYAFGLHEGLHPYYAMELLLGETLHEKIHGSSRRARRDRIPLVPAIEWMIQLAEAVNHLHSVGIVHGDLRPDKVFITNESRVKGLDLSTLKLGRLGLPITRAGRAAATPHYACPEQIRGLQKESPSWDVYALGFLLYECLAGRYLFSDHPGQSHSDAELRAWHSHRARPSLLAIDPGYPPELDRILEKAVSPLSTFRFQTASAFMIALLGLRRILGERGQLDPLVSLSRRKGDSAPHSRVSLCEPAPPVPVRVAKAEAPVARPETASRGANLEAAAPAAMPEGAARGAKLEAAAPIAMLEATGVEAILSEEDSEREAELLDRQLELQDPPRSRRRIRPDLRPAFARGLAAGMVAMLGIVVVTALVVGWRLRPRGGATAEAPAVLLVPDAPLAAPLTAPFMAPSVAATSAVSESVAPAPTTTAAAPAPTTTAAAPAPTTTAAATAPPRAAPIGQRIGAALLPGPGELIPRTPASPRADACPDQRIYCDLEDEPRKPSTKKPARGSARAPVKTPPSGPAPPH